MKRSTKIGTAILVFFLIITIVIVGRTMIGNHFKKKFSKRPPPGIIVTEVVAKNFSQKVSTYGTAIPFRTKSYKIEKYEIVNPIEFNKKLKKGDLITKLKTRNLIASFDGVVTKRDFSNDIKVSESSLLIQLEDTSIIYVDVDIPELYSGFIKLVSGMLMEFLSLYLTIISKREPGKISKLSFSNFILIARDLVSTSILPAVESTTPE